MAQRKVQETRPIKKRTKTTAQGSRNRESSAAKAYRLQRAAKLSTISAGTCKLDSECHDVYDFPETSAWPSPPSSIEGGPPFINITNVPGDDGRDSDTSKANNNVETGTSDLPIDAVIDILAATKHDFDLTETAFASVMKHAAAAATPDDRFGVLFVRDLVCRVAELSAQDEWLVIVVDQLQQRLSSLSDRARCQISALGKLSLPNDLSSGVEIAQPGTKACPGSTPSSEDAFVTPEGSTNVVVPEVANSIEDEDIHIIHATHSQNKERRPNPKHSQKGVSLSRQEQHRSLLGSALTTEEVSRISRSNDGASTPCAPNPCFGSAYDLFARSVLDAHPSLSSPVCRNQHAYKSRITRLWDGAPPAHRVAWMKLFNARPDAVPLLVHGQQLLLSQGMLKGSPKSGYRSKHNR